MTGLRLGEATGLLWSDLDESSMSVEINKNLVYKTKTNYYYKDPKTKSSFRTICLDEKNLPIPFGMEGKTIKCEVRNGYYIEL